MKQISFCNRRTLVDFTKRFWVNLLNFFHKLDYFSTWRFYTSSFWKDLAYKGACKLTPKNSYEMYPRGLYYKTFYGSNYCRIAIS
jgi:hypothetical protein